MGKNDQTTTQKLDPTAEKMRNIYYNATLDKLGMGSLSGYGKGGAPIPPGAAHSGHLPATLSGAFGHGLFPEVGGFGGPGGPSGPSGPFGPGGRPNITPGTIPQEGGITAFDGGMMNSRMPPGGPNIGPGMPGGDPWEQSTNNAGTNVAGYDQGFGQAYRGMQGLGDANTRQMGLGYDAANRFLDPAQAAADTQARMNPYMTGVIDPIKALQAENLAKAQQAVGNNASMQGAFGGTRHGVAEGEAARGITLDTNRQLADLYNNGYINAQNQTMQAGMFGGNLGMGAGAMAAQNYGAQGAFSEQARQLAQQKLDSPFRDLGILGSTVNGSPFGQTITASGSGGNPFTGALGGAAAGFGIGGPIGAGIGAGVGLLGSFF